MRRLCGRKGAKRFHFIGRVVVSYLTSELVGQDKLDRAGGLSGGIRAGEGKVCGQGEP
ncbi:hypothetical protein [Thermocrinis sp.]|uniref:hypothetical protein n=1 Tax=Thermocrinis sp. TaxID=2024383 RepID=UPI003BFDDA1A